MAAGWNLKSGEITQYKVSSSDLWATFKYVFSDDCKKSSTYKFGWIKTILDNLSKAIPSKRGWELTYDTLFETFAEIYWPLITEYHIKQIRSTTRYKASKLEIICQEIYSRYPSNRQIKFRDLTQKDISDVIKSVSKECRRCVVGAIYQDFSGKLYGFDLKESGIWLNPAAYEFMLRNKNEIEELNYYSWAEFMDRLNYRDASIYRSVLRKATGHQK